MHTETQEDLIPIVAELSEMLIADDDELVVDEQRFAEWQMRIAARPPLNRNLVAEHIIALAVSIQRSAQPADAVLETLCEAAAGLMVDLEESDDPDARQTRHASFQALVGDEDKKAAPRYGAAAPRGSFTIASLGPRFGPRSKR